MKGVSSWNFDLAALKAQAASEPDDGSVPQTPTFPAMPTIMEGPEVVEGEGSGEGSRRSTDDAAAVPLTPAAALAVATAAGAIVAAQQVPVQVTQQQQQPGQQQQQVVVQQTVPVVQHQTVAVQQQQQGSMQLMQQPLQQQGTAVQQQLEANAVASQLQQQQQQNNAANMRRASSAFAGSTALAAAAAAAGANIHPTAVGNTQLQGHFSEPAAVVLSQQQSASAAINITGGTSGGSSYCVSPLNGSPPMSRESSSQGPLGALAGTPEAISLKGKSKGRHGRFQVYEHGEEPPPMSPPANKALQEGLSGSFTRSGDGRLSDPAAEGSVAGSVKQTPESEGLLAAAVAGQVSAAAPVALCNGSGPAPVAPGGTVVGFAAGADSAAAAAAEGVAALGSASGTATPPLPPAGPSAGVAVSGTLSEGLDAAGTTEPKKRGRFKIIEEEPSATSRGSVSKVPSSADLGKSGALRGALTGTGVMLELQKLHEQAINHQQALGSLIDRMKAGGSLGNLASAGEESSAAAPVTAAGVARKLSNTGSLSRSTSNKTLGGGLDLRQLTLQLLLPAYDNSIEEVAEKLLERGQDLERRLSDVLEENQRLRLKLALSDAGVGGGGYGGDSLSGSGAAGAGSSNNMAAMAASSLRSELGESSNLMSRTASRRASVANQGVPSVGATGQQQQQQAGLAPAVAAATAAGPSSGGGQGAAGAGLGDRNSSGGAGGDSTGSAAAVGGTGGNGVPRVSGSGSNEAAAAATSPDGAVTPTGSSAAAGGGSLARDSVAGMLWKG